MVRSCFTVCMLLSILVIRAAALHLNMEESLSFFGYSPFIVFEGDIENGLRCNPAATESGTDGPVVRSGFVYSDYYNFENTTQKTFYGQYAGAGPYGVDVGMFYRDPFFTTYGSSGIRAAMRILPGLRGGVVIKNVDREYNVDAGAYFSTPTFDQPLFRYRAGVLVKNALPLMTEGGWEYVDSTGRVVSRESRMPLTVYSGNGVDVSIGKHMRFGLLAGYAYRYVSYEPVPGYIIPREKSSSVLEIGAEFSYANIFVCEFRRPFMFIDGPKPGDSMNLTIEIGMRSDMIEFLKTLPVQGGVKFGIGTDEYAVSTVLEYVLE